MKWEAECEMDFRLWFGVTYQNQVQLWNNGVLNKMEVYFSLTEKKLRSRQSPQCKREATVTEHEHPMSRCSGILTVVSHG